MTNTTINSNDQRQRGGEAVVAVLSSSAETGPGGQRGKPTNVLVYLRRSAIMIVLVCLAFFGFVYAFAGTGVAQLFFGHQANGSITANGSTLIGQNWAATSVPGTSHRQLRLPRPTRRHRPLRRRRLRLQRKELHAKLRW